MKPAMSSYSGGKSRRILGTGNTVPGSNASSRSVESFLRGVRACPACPWSSIALASLLLLIASTTAGVAQESVKGPVAQDEDLTLVRVKIMTETRGPIVPLEINGKSIPGYQPNIIHMFPSTGVVMDDSGHVLTFLGYRWVDLQQADPRVDIVTWKGERYRGKLVGIDHALGVAVVRSSGGKLRRTLVCRGCEIRGGDVMVAPAVGSPGESQFLNAQILSVETEADTAVSGSWNIVINRNLPGIGEALLDKRFRVLGFVANQRPSREDPVGMKTVAYPIAQLLDSADRIIRAGGNIHDGWLGVSLDEAPPSVPGARIKVVMDDSPAQKAGLRPQDTIVSLNGKEIRDDLQLIRMVQESPVGSKVTLGVVRQGRPATLQAVIQPLRMMERPTGRFMLRFPNSMMQAELGYGIDTSAPGDESAAWAGIETAPLTPQMADFMNIPGRTGVLVLNVDSSMPFSRAGIRAGDVIVSVNGQPVDDPQTLFAHLKIYSRNAQQVILKMVHKGVERITTIQLPLAPPRKQK